MSRLRSIPPSVLCMGKWAINAYRDVCAQLAAYGVDGALGRGGNGCIVWRYALELSAQRQVFLRIIARTPWDFSLEVGHADYVRRKISYSIVDRQPLVFSLLLAHKDIVSSIGS